MELVLFFIFKVLTILSAIAVVNVKNPVHSILCLILVFVNVTGILLLLGLEFLAMVYVVVYVGAIAVLFLFVVMMLNIKLVEARASELNYLPLNAFVLLLFGSELSYLVYSTFHPMLSGHKYEYLSFVQYIDAFSNMESLGMALYTFYFLPFFLVGFVLLVAMIGSISLTLYHQSGIRRQLISVQKTRDHKLVLRNIY